MKWSLIAQEPTVTISTSYSNLWPSSINDRIQNVELYSVRRVEGSTLKGQPAPAWSARRSIAQGTVQWRRWNQICTSITARIAGNWRNGLRSAISWRDKAICERETHTFAGYAEISLPTKSTSSTTSVKTHLFLIALNALVLLRKRRTFKLRLDQISNTLSSRMSKLENVCPFNLLAIMVFRRDVIEFVRKRTWF
jgi:hypothetical protein